MKTKIFIQILTFLLVVSCNSSGLMSPSKYETVYSKTIDAQEHDTIYELLKRNFSDFPDTRHKKIKYSQEQEGYSLRINLKENNFKLVYHSNIGENEKIKSLQDQIEKITSD